VSATNGRFPCPWRRQSSISRSQAHRAGAIVVAPAIAARWCARETSWRWHARRAPARCQAS
jgi:hypothetical protein